MPLSGVGEVAVLTITRSIAGCGGGAQVTVTVTVALSEPVALVSLVTKLAVFGCELGPHGTVTFAPLPCVPNVRPYSNVLFWSPAQTVPSTPLSVSVTVTHSSISVVEALAKSTAAEPVKAAVVPDAVALPSSS